MLDGLETKDEIIERMTDHVRSGMAVCLAHHGRSPLIAEVLREAIALGRAENWLSAIAPGVSVLDCLFSDLGLDPLRDGCQIFAAEHFLERRLRLNTSTALVVSLGDNAVFADVLALLRDEYGADHPAIVYEPARTPSSNPSFATTPSAASTHATSTACRICASHRKSIMPECNMDKRGALRMVFAFGVAAAGHGTADAPDAGMFQPRDRNYPFPHIQVGKRVPPLVYKKPVAPFREMLASVARMKLRCRLADFGVR